jgi:hypothetical protein
MHRAAPDSDRVRPDERGSSGRKPTDIFGSAWRYAASAVAAFAVWVAMTASSGVTAKNVVDPRCEWFGEAPFCDGECPAGWTERKRNKRGDGNKCATGSKVYCCDFQERCVPERAPGWKPGTTRVTDEGIVECQECRRWGDDCRRGGEPRFNAVCAHYEWVPCGRAPARKDEPKGGRDIGLPLPAPDQPAAPEAPPPCKPPREMRNGYCVCPRGLMGEFCNSPDVR